MCAGKSENQNPEGSYLSIMEIRNFKPYDGQHCETTATGTLLSQLDISISEPMLFGLGEGLSFIYWKMKSMDYPFIGGRIKPDLLTKNIVKNLGLKLVALETSSKAKAWKNVKDLLDEGRVVGLKLDSYYLEYFSRPIHFAGHYVAIYGYDEESAYLVDTRQQGGKVKTSLNSLALARSEKGPMSSKSLLYYLEKPRDTCNIKEAVRRAIQCNAKEYLNPPITNVSYKGILKTATELNRWFKTSKDVEQEFGTTALLMEKAGTGGALFRNLYRDFLGESGALLKSEKVMTAHESFRDIAALWASISELFAKAGKTREITYVDQAAGLLRAVSEKEKRAMELLA